MNKKKFLHSCHREKCIQGHITSLVSDKASSERQKTFHLVKKSIYKNNHNLNLLSWKKHLSKGFSGLNKTGGDK